MTRPREPRDGRLPARRRGPSSTADFERVYTLFPRLKERLGQNGGTLSGGEQQMLAIGRALMARPKLLLLDEPSMGLAPILVEQIFEIVRDINASRDDGPARRAERAHGARHRAARLHPADGRDRPPGRGRQARWSTPRSRRPTWAAEPPSAARRRREPGRPWRSRCRPTLHPIAADGRLAPDPAPDARAVDEQPAAERVPARAGSSRSSASASGGRQEVVDDAVPAGGRRAHVRPRASRKRDRGPGPRRRRARQASLDRARRIVGQGADGGPDGAQPGELGGASGSSGGAGICVRAPGTRGHRRRRQVVVRRLVRPAPGGGSGRPGRGRCWRGPGRRRGRAAM